MQISNRHKDSIVQQKHKSTYATNNYIQDRAKHDQLNSMLAGRSGLVVTRLPAAREDPGSRRAAGKSLCFHENHCDMQLWARAAH